MIKIAICDDEKTVVDEIEKILETVEVSFEEDIQTSKFFDGKDLIQTIVLGKSFDLIFLDIEMPELTGLEFSRELRTKLNDKKTQIVFVSSKDKYMAQLFDFAPLKFIQKNKTREEIVNPEKIKEAIQYFMDERYQDGEQFIFKKNKEIIQIPIKEILYFKLESRKMTVKTIYEKEYFNETLKVVEESVKGKGFVRCTENIIVNSSFIKNFDWTNVYLYTGEKLPLSIRNKSKINKIMKVGIK